MPLNLTTSNPAAMESLTEGLRAIDQYYQSRQVPYIERANKCLDAALEKDNNYGLAIYYKGVVLDLIGKAADAPPHFKRILTECDIPALKWESIFNLGVAEYHRYSHPHLEEARRYFDEVICGTADPKLKLLSRAHLAQVHAMWMRPSEEQHPDKHKPVSAEVCKHIEEHFKICQGLIKDLRNAHVTEDRIVATYENANGMANMYITDHIQRDVVARQQHLEMSLKSLTEADRKLRNDWANTCDLGSANLRFAVLARDMKKPAEMDSYFNTGTKHLLRVVNELRPGYGFALYELGILHRVWGKWQEATAYMTSALQVPEPYRDISDKGVRTEQARVDKHDDRHP